MNSVFKKGAWVSSGDWNICRSDAIVMQTQISPKRIKKKSIGRLLAIDLCTLAQILRCRPRYE